MDIIIFLVFLYGIFFNVKGLPTACCIALLTDGFYVLNHISTFPFTHEMSDTGLIALAIIFLTQNKTICPPNLRSSKIAALFLIFVSFSIFIDMMCNDIDLLSICKTSRHWIGIFAFFLFIKLPQEYAQKTTSIIGIILIVLTVIQIFDWYINLGLFSDYSIIEGTHSAYRRGSIPSILLFYYFYYLQSNTKSIGYYVYPVLGIILLSILLSGIRTFLLALILGECLLYFIRAYNKKVSPKELLILTTAIILLSIAIYQIPQIRERLVDFKSEINNEDYQYTRKFYNGNFSFRMELFWERFDYISQNFRTKIFGIGNVTEKNFSGSFLISHNEAQLDTADSSWVLLVLRTGLAGTIIYITMSVVFIVECIHYKNPNKWPLIIYISLSLLILSFSSSAFSRGYFWVFPSVALASLYNPPESNDKELINK